MSLLTEPRNYGPGKNIRDMTGIAFGRLTVIKTLGRYNKRSYYLCKCTCGNSVEVASWDLTAGRTKSCGCLKLENYKTASLKHGFASAGKSRHPLYHTWASMVKRCTNPNSAVWNHYGGRGITVCTEWRTFANFKEDMFSSWSEGMTLERLDANLGYCKENCIWIPKSKQMSNTRDSLALPYHGKLYSLIDLATSKGMTYRTLYSRLASHDITVEEAVDGYVSGKYPRLAKSRSMEHFKKYKNGNYSK